MEDSEISNCPKYSFKLDLEALTNSHLRDPLMKYQTMATNGELKEIELSSEYSEFEESESSITGSSNIACHSQINSQRDIPSNQAFSKLLNLTPKKHFSSEKLHFSPRLTCQENTIKFNNWNQLVRLSTGSISENRSLRSKKEIQRDIQNKALINMTKVMGKILWIVIYSIALSATPALLIGLPGDNMLILMTWKIQITLIVFVVFACIELSVIEDLEKKFKPISKKKWFHIVLAGFMYLIWLLGLLEACRYTIVLHALLLNNFLVFLAPVFAILVRNYIGTYQIFGVIAWLIGALLWLYSSFFGQWILDSKLNEMWDPTFDILNMLSSFAGFIYFLMIDKLQKSIPKFTLRALITLWSLSISFIYLMLEDMFVEENYFNFNKETGVFGWTLSIPSPVLIIFIISTVGWLFGNMSQRQISNLLFLEPFVGQYIAVFVIQINENPPITSVVGWAISLLGMYILRENYFGDFNPRTEKAIKVEELETEMEVKQLKKYLPQKSL